MNTWQLLQHLRASVLTADGLSRRQRRQHVSARQRRGRSHRVLFAEQLEDRRLMVAEGNLFNLSQPLDSAGLFGALTATVRWGDGGETAATVSALPAAGPLRVKLDYSLITSPFFSAPATTPNSPRALLQQAADSLVSRFNDDLAAISPSGSNTWTAKFTNPVTGAEDTRDNLLVAANEIIVFVGARDLPGNTRGFGGPGGFGAMGSQAWLDNVRSRGEAGALANPQTDFGPWGGSIAFDNADTNWFFGTDTSAIQNDQTDFLTVATHELAHVLGFGFIPTSPTTSWDNLSIGGSFSGPKSIASFGTGGNVPLQLGALNDRGHWMEGIQSAGRETLMDPTLLSGTRTLMTPLDFAALDDLGWDVSPSLVTVTATHTYADNRSYPIEVVLRGANGQLVATQNAIITNAIPTLTVPGNQTVTVGQTLSLPNIGQISDPGFANSVATPPSVETFTYSINWGDQSPVDTGTATIDRPGSAGQPTLASFDGSHLFATPGTYTVRVQTQDDDNGSSIEQSFTVVVAAQPTLMLTLDRTSIAEDAGADAATLTVTRSGPAPTTAQTILLTSNDISEATLPTSITIPAGQTSATAKIQAIDDTLLDGEQTVVITATGNGIQNATINLTVTDRESITASFNLASIREDAATNSLTLTITRSNTDTTAPQIVNITGGDASQLVIASPVMIPAGQTSVTVMLTPVNDSAPEPRKTLEYSFTATGYHQGAASIDILDDEPPKFQRQSNRFDVNGLGGVSAGDALEIIRELNVRGDNPNLNPVTEEPNGIFVDVNGDYRVTALDALEIINELNRLPRLATATSDAEDFVSGTAPTPAEAYDRALSELDDSSPHIASALNGSDALDDDERRRRSPTPQLGSSQLF